MKVQEVILRAMAKKIMWYQAAEIIGIRDRHMRRWPERYEEFGYDRLFDRRRGKPSPTGAAGVGRAGSGAVPRALSRSEGAALSREAEEQHQIELKFDVWSAINGTSAEAAMQQYISLVASLRR